MSSEVLNPKYKLDNQKYAPSSYQEIPKDQAFSLLGCGHLLLSPTDYGILLMLEDGRTPMMRMLDLWEFPDMEMEHTFGCPVYILDSKLQSSSIGPPKWDPRTRLGIYVGRSPYHAGSVALVLNPRTGHVSPQYHLVFDDDFSTVPFMHSNDVPHHWEVLVKSSTELAMDEDFSLVETWYEQSMNEFDLEKEKVSFEPQQDK